MSLLRKLERRDYSGGTFTNPYPYGPPGSIPTNGQLGIVNGLLPLTAENAMRNWAVWACIRIIGDTVSGLPIDLFTQNVGGDPTPVEPLPKVLLRPSAYLTRVQWLHQVMTSELLHGNAYGLIASTDRLGYPNQIEIIDPYGVRVDRDNTGRKTFHIGSETLHDDRVWHLPGPMMPGCLEGLNPVQYASRTIGLGLNAEKFGADYFANGAHPTATAQTDQLVTEEQADIIKDRIYRATQNRQIAVLGAGLKLEQWQVNPNESQFLETQRFNAIMISQMFGVPPEYLGVASSGSSVTYANREQRAQDFLNNAVNPWLARLEEALSAWFPRTMYVKFNTGALLRSDLQGRFIAYGIGIDKGFMQRSQARALEDWPAIPGIDDQPAPTAVTKVQMVPPAGG